MQQNHYYDANKCMRCSNSGLFVYSIYESIVLDNIPIAGITNFGLEVKNNSSSGNVIDVSTYGSPNGVDYYPIENNIFQGIIGPKTLEHVEFTLVSGFLRITIKSDADINIDVYLHGNLT